MLSPLYPSADRTLLWKIFLSALAIRWSYAGAIFLAMGDAGLQGIDSIDYLANAHDLAARMADGSLSGLQWLGIRGYAMPIFQLLLGLCALIFGTWTSLAYVLVQGVLDAGTCVLIFALAGTFNERYAAPAGIVAALNPTQIVVSGLVYTDTPFLFFSALLLLAAVRWLLAPTWKWTVAIGLALGLGTLTRPLAAPFTPLLLLFLASACVVRGGLSRRAIAQLAAAAAIFFVCIAPVVLRNVTQFGSWALTAQSGDHFARWIVPLIKEAQDGTPWQTTYDEMDRRTNERYPSAKDPFERSRQYTEVASEELAKLGVGAVANAWLTGAAINLMSPAIILSPPVSRLPRSRYYETPGTSPFDKAVNFLFRSQNRLYSWILIAGISGVALMRAIQLLGAIALLRQGGHLPALLLFGLWIAYVLAINGPVASPKYRLPIEPPLMVLAGAALSAMRSRRTQ